MKKFLVIIFLLLAGCSTNESSVTIIKGTTNYDDLTDITLMCIDNVTYIIVPGVGMSVKLNIFGMPKYC